MVGTGTALVGRYRYAMENETFTGEYIHYTQIYLQYIAELCLDYKCNKSYYNI